jgi:cytochrome c556
MNKLRSLMILTVIVAACGGQESAAPASAPAPAPKPAGPTQQPYASLAQIMRALPFGASNIIFDTQTNDPEAPPKKEAGGDSASARFASVYKGWQVVEHSSLALSEMANLMLIPGRLCENGKPVPLDREDFRKFIQGLADAGKAAYKAAQSKNQDQMIEVSDTVATACANCHEVYRDTEPRCTPPATPPAAPPAAK